MALNFQTVFLEFEERFDFSIFLHFDMASKSTGTAGSLSKVEKSLNLKCTFPYRFTYTVYFLFGEMSIGDEGEIKSGPGFKAIAFCFFTSLNKS